MFTCRGHILRFAWVVLIAALAFALVSPVSRMLAKLQGASAWAEVCTPQGTQWVALNEGGADESAPSPLAGHLDHCAYCVLGSALPGVPAAAATTPKLLSLSHALPLVFLQGPRTLVAWTVAQPRAPPPAA